MEIVENDCNVVKSKALLSVSEFTEDVYEEDYSLQMEEFDYLEMFPEFSWEN